MLHTVNKSPFETNSLETCLRLARKGSDILLIEDAVYGAMQGSKISETVREAASTHRIYTLEPDLMARGLAKDQIIDGIETVGYDGFVELAASNDTVQTWL